jgi:transglutaminase/protease-like cytokinesis protein 3
MNYQTFSSDIPQQRTITFGSAEEVEETFLNLGVSQEMQQLGRGSFQADLALRSTEFADLFTTLARSLGIPARTVFGLAYDDGNEPAFAFHAWNEVSVDGVWQSVDPTWNQLRVDATHIPLPSNQSAALQLITGSVDLNFSVREVDYFTSDQG